MNKYTIIKKVIAKNIRDALKKEGDVEPSEVYQDYTYDHAKNSTIGFTGTARTAEVKKKKGSGCNSIDYRMVQK